MERETAPAAPRGWLDRLGLGRRELRSWALYDWANSAFATTIMAAVLPIYYSRVAAGELPGNVATAYWSYTVAGSVVLIVLLAPVLGAIADHMGAKKRFLSAFLAFGVAGTAALYFAREGDWLLASGLYMAAAVGFSGANVFYDALLPHIARPREVDRVSAAGFALGYVGGGLLLLVNLIMIERPELLGFADAGVATRWAFISVAAWWAIFSIPLLRDVPEPPRPVVDEVADRPADGVAARVDADGDVPARVNPVVAGFRRLARVSAEVRRYPQAFIFLLAFWLYMDGRETIVRMATIYGTEIGIGQGALIGALLLTQFVGIPFTFAFGALAGRIGAKRGIYLTLVVYTAVAIFGFFLREAWHFWVLAGAVGMVQGGTLALSRSLYATLIPERKSAEFFGFYSIFNKSSGVLGPLVFGVVAQVTGTGRFAIASLLVFFVGGLLLLARVDVDAGRRAAGAATAPSDATEPGGTPLAL